MLNTRVVDIDDDEEPVVAAPVVVRTTPATVRSTISAPPRRPTPAPATDLTRSRGAEWTAADLQAYVLRKMGETSRAHSTLRPQRLPSVFVGFVKRHGATRARRIAEYAFETHSEPGYWYSTPITPTRFCANSDKYFADVISARLAD